MREIKVTTDVFALIWQLRQSGENTENDILNRILQRAANEPCGDKSPNGLSQPEFELRERHLEIEMEFASGLHTQSAWWQVVEAALRRLGGKAELHYIYREVKIVCVKTGKRVPRSLDATVRGTLEDNCYESHRYKGVRDVFAMAEGKGRGVWALKQA